MSHMFDYARSVILDISDWNVSKVTDMSYMFASAYSSNPDMTQWDFSSVENMEGMFAGLTLAPETYSALLNQINTTSQKENVTLEGWTTKYDDSGTEARNALIARGWTITDRGNINNPLPFVSKWKINNDNGSIILPLREGYNYDFSVDWGDGSSSQVTSYDDSDITHTYADSGEYTITISGLVEAWYFNNSGSKDNILSVSDLGDVGWKNLKAAFSGCSRLRMIRGGNLSNVTTMSNMFINTSITPDVSRWDVSNVKDMYNMFYNTNHTDAHFDVSRWNVSKVEDMAGLFYKTKNTDIDVRHWDLSSVNYINGIFHSSQYNPDVSRWDVSKIEFLAGMFHNARSANPDVSRWDVSGATNLYQLFRQATSANPDVSRWDVSNVTNMKNMFYSATSANPDISQWDFRDVENMEGFFHNKTLPTETYSQILNRINETATKDNVTLNGGFSKYNEDAASSAKLS